MKSRTNVGMTGPKIGLIVTTALASMALAGCTTSAAPRAEASFSKAQAALEKGQVSKAIVHAEAAVLAEPRNPGFRAMLGAAYLEDGRFEAAATSFDDALELGDADPRTVLSYALAAIATGDSAGALAALAQREGDLNPADYGLAIALAGNPERGIHVLTNALRGGQNTAKVRQNLAYTYALAGNWPGARVMAAEDVPADQLDARLTEWASNAAPEDVAKRVAALLGVSVSGGGQPDHLALANFPSQEAMVAEASVQAETPVARELGDADLAVNAEGDDVTEVAQIAEIQAAPSQTEKLAFRIDSDVKEVEPNTPAETQVDSTVASILAATGPAPVAAASAPPVAAPVPAAAPAKVATVSENPRFISTPMIQKITEAMREQSKAPRRVASASSQRRMAASPTQKAPAASDKAKNSHLVQLGSYTSRNEAKRGWLSLQSKFPELKGHDVVITKAKVKGKIYYRVAAAGFGPRSARSLCGSVKSAGRGCFAYAKSSPPKGAIDNGVRIAARSR